MVGVIIRKGEDHAVKAEVELRARIMSGGVRALGPGKADLLEHIQETGSISAAAKRMKMSYSRAWTLVDEMNGAFKRPLVEAATGGAGGGGAQVTEAGRTALALYREMEAALETMAAAFLPRFRKLI
jgi:molybdate transport system regulatory protein